MTTRPDASNLPAENSLAAQLEELQLLALENSNAYLERAEAWAAAVRAPDTPAIERSLVLSELGNARRTTGRFADAVAALSEAIAAAEDVPAGEEREAILARTRMRLAIVSDVTGDVVEAFDQLDRATRHFEAVPDEAGLARCDMVRAGLYQRIEDYEEAIICCRRALAYYRLTGQTERIAMVLSNLTSALWHVQQFEEALAAGREAVRLASSPLVRNAAIGNLATALGDAGELDEALELHLSTKDAIAAIGGPQYTITYKRAVGSILAKKGELQPALEMLKSALAEAEALGFQRDVTQCHGFLARIYGDLGDFEQAYRHLNQHHDMVQTQNRQNTANQLEVHKWRLKLETAQQQTAKISARAAELEWSSYRDSLTELANRRYFDQRLGDFIQHNQETDEDLSVIILDLDRFKDINDEYGHLIGDQVLRATGQILQNGTRRSDVVARLGGEEFAVLLTMDIQPGYQHGVADKLRQAFQDHDWDSIAPGIVTTVSVGVASLSETGRDPLKLLELADRRLYMAKRGGRNRVVSEG